ncbi:hypothetical protein GCM10027519_42640 [Kineococcus endophyticus]
MKLTALPLAPEAGAERYARTLFGQTWADVDGNGCSTRNDVLARDLTNVKTAADGCAVTYGVLADPYSGLTVQFQRGQETSRLVPIDHRVPLAEAWASGASGWTEDERLRFANDPANLVATTEGENSGKSDQDPAEWLPSWRGGWCTYTVAYIDVKATWRLSVDQAEADAAQPAPGHLLTPPPTPPPRPPLHPPRRHPRRRSQPPHVRPAPQHRKVTTS